MKKMKNKKAIEPIIATVLLIVIVIAAAAIVWGVVIPLIREQVETSCLDTMQMGIDREWTCLEDDCLQFKITRDSKNFDLTGIIVMVTDKEGNTQKVTLGKDLTQMKDCYLETAPKPITLPGVLEEKVYKLNLTEIGFELGTEIIGMKIAPIIKVGEKEKNCDIVAELAIESCSIY